jgi:tRNA-Thr(GGU) m(6)t(6)A37 methyltransferase TsaA
MGQTVETTEIKFTPIGYFKSQQVHPYEAGRQPDAHHADGVIELASGHNFEQALTGFEVGQRLWIVFVFHHNQHWNPMVLPPRGSDTKVGVFATRSPYRPNPIGISCVRLIEVNKLKLRVAEADILDGTPILDIKPYVSYADSFPGFEPPWMQNSPKFEIRFSAPADKKLNWLEQNGVTQLRSFIQHQLEYEPTNEKKKRVSAEVDNFVLCYRTWRVRFEVTENALTVTDLFSGYSDKDLQNHEDPYQDKEIHRKFNSLKN